MKNYLDLRFIIGLFFLLVGIALFVTALTIQPVPGKTETANFWGGITYIIFGLFMLLLQAFGKKKKPEEIKNA